jgi:hypothetical protein
MCFIFWPAAPDCTKLVCTWLFAQEALARGLCKPDETVLFWDNANREDWSVCVLVQEGVASGSYEPSRLRIRKTYWFLFSREVLEALSDSGECCNPERYSQTVCDPPLSERLVRDVVRNLERTVAND